MHLNTAYEKREDRSDTFNPNSEYVAKSTQQYLDDGGAITVLAKDPDIDCAKHYIHGMDINTDVFL